MKQSKTVLKSYFQKGDKPTEEQFVDLIDSFIHEDDTTKTFINSVEAIKNGDTVVKLSSGAKFTISKPVEKVQDNKVRVIDLGNIRFLAPVGEGRELSKERGLVNEEIGNSITPKRPVTGLLESVLGRVVSKLNPPISIEEDEIVIFEYNIVRNLEM